MIRNLLILKNLKIHGGLIDVLVNYFSEEEFKKLFNGETIELQFKYNIFKDEELDVFSDYKLVELAKSRADKIIEDCKKLDIEILSFYDASYPSQLKKIDIKPLILYAKGNTNILQSSKFIACVGTRSTSVKAIEAVKEIVRGLVKDNQIIVSGLAKGIDAEAHKSCLRNNGNTVAVLAHGLDFIYPNEHKKLAEEILNKNGVLLSEYPPYTKLIKRNFIARNNIVAGMSNAVIVFEADENSGTMHTARFAYTQRKKIFCPIFLNDKLGNLSTGVLKLVNTKSAFLVKSVEEIIGVLGDKNSKETKTLENKNEEYVNSIRTNKLGASSENFQSLYFHLDSKLYKELDGIAEQQHMSIEELVSSIVSQYVWGNKGGEIDE